jgi:squalene-hopene/tetraprenyl-beta-curcumene cyclase
MNARATDWLIAAQNSDGGWGGAPGIASSIEETSVAVSALCGAGGERAAAAVRRGATWLIEATRCGTETPPSPIGLYFARLWYHERLYPLIFAAGALSRARAQLAGIG